MRLHSLFLLVPFVNAVETLTERVCGTTTTPEEIVFHEAQFVRLKASKVQALDVQDDGDGQAAEAGPLPPISVVWHVIYTNETIDGGYLPDDQVNSSISAMNDHYNSTGITFALTQINRVQNDTWFVGADPVYNKTQAEMKTALRVGDASTLNIYTVGFGTVHTKGLLGYSTFPWIYPNNNLDDGVVILYSTVPGGSRKNFDEGKTLSHEVGHWLGLYHVFEGGCSEPGDYVDDTPPQVKATTGCPADQDSCPGDGVDRIHNFMDYSYDSCLYEWTPGQTQRIKEQILYWRNISSTSGQ